MIGIYYYERFFKPVFGCCLFVVTSKFFLQFFICFQIGKIRAAMYFDATWNVCIEFKDTHDARRADNLGCGIVEQPTTTST